MTVCWARNRLQYICLVVSYNAIHLDWPNYTILYLTGVTQYPPTNFVVQGDWTIVRRKVHDISHGWNLIDIEVNLNS
jgi:hypothetical protein